MQKFGYLLESNLVEELIQFWLALSLLSITLPYADTDDRADVGVAWEILQVYEGIKDCALKNGYPRRKDGSYIALCEGFRAIAFGMQLMKEFDRPNLAAMHWAQGIFLMNVALNWRDITVRKL